MWFALISPTRGLSHVATRSSALASCIRSCCCHRCELAFHFLPSFLIFRCLEPRIIMSFFIACCFFCRERPEKKVHDASRRGQSFHGGAHSQPCTLRHPRNQLSSNSLRDKSTHRGPSFADVASFQQRLLWHMTTLQKKKGSTTDHIKRRCWELRRSMYFLCCDTSLCRSNLRPFGSMGLECFEDVLSCSNWDARPFRCQLVVVKPQRLPSLLSCTVHTAKEVAVLSQNSFISCYPAPQTLPINAKQKDLTACVRDNDNDNDTPSKN